MMSNEQLNASQKAQLDQWFELADKSLDETEKLMDLQLNACRDTLQEMAHCCQSACDIRDMASAYSWQTGAFKPFAEHSAQYGARLMGLASGSGREFTRSFENQWQQMARQMSGWMAPAMPSDASGPQAALDYLRNTMQAFDSVWSSALQPLEQSRQTSMHALQGRKSPGKTGQRKAH